MNPNRPTPSRITGPFAARSVPLVLALALSLVLGLAGIGAATAADQARRAVEFFASWPDEPVPYDDPVQASFFVDGAPKAGTYTITLARKPGTPEEQGQFVTVFSDTDDLEQFRQTWSFSRSYELPQDPGHSTWRVTVVLRDQNGTAFYSVTEDAAVTRVPNQMTTTRYLTGITFNDDSRRVTSGATAQVTGQVRSPYADGMARRSVQIGLSTTTKGSFHLIDTVLTDQDGHFAATVPTYFTYDRTLIARVGEKQFEIPRTSDDPRGPGYDIAIADAGSSLKGTRIKVDMPDLGYKPKGRAAENALLSPGRTFDACRTLTYRVNPQGMPKMALSIIRDAFGDITTMTGYRFAYDGPTSHRYLSGGFDKKHTLKNDLDPDADFTLAFATPRQLNWKHFGALGFGGQSTSSKWVEAAGAVFRDDDWINRYRYTNAKRAWSGLIRHELGHAMGLGHTNDRVQVMESSLLHSLRGVYEAGDLAGLRRVSTEVRGCRSDNYAARRIGAATETYLR